MAARPPVGIFDQWFRENTGPDTATAAGYLEALNVLVAQLTSYQQVDIASGVLPALAGTVKLQARRLLVDTEADAPADDLDFISPANYPDGFSIAVEVAFAGRAVTVRHLVDGVTPGRIILWDGANQLLNQIGKVLFLQLEGDTWREVRPLAAATGGGGGGDPNVTVASVVTSDQTLAESHFCTAAATIETPVDCAAANRVVNVGLGLVTPAGQRRLALFRKLGSANALQVRSLGAGDGSTPVIIAEDVLSYTTDVATDVVNSANLGPQKSFAIPAAANVTWGFAVFLNCKDAASRAFSVEVNGQIVVFNNKAENGASESAPSVYLFYQSIGTVPSGGVVKQIQPKVGATGGARSYIMFPFAVSGAHPTDLAEGVDINFSTSQSATKTITAGSTGVNRRCFYFGADRQNNSTLPAITNATQLRQHRTGVATGTNMNANLSAASGQEAAASAGTNDALITFDASRVHAWVGLAIKPAPAAGGIVIKGPNGSTAPDITSENALVALEYDGNNNECYVTASG